MLSIAPSSNRKVKIILLLLSDHTQYYISCAFAALKKSDQVFCHNYNPEQPEDHCVYTGPSYILQDLRPVCGSNKVTYNSKNDLLCAAKAKPGW
jgi:hypothetical protein